MNIATLKIRIDRLLESCCAFPCPGCKTTLSAEGKNFFCADCRGKLQPIQPPICPGCGGSLDGVLELCAKCLAGDKRPWVKAYALFNLDGYGRELVHNLKYRSSPELARAFGGMAAQLLRPDLEQFDFIVPTPLHWSRQWVRGYNQSELLCKIISEHTGIPTKSVLQRVKMTRQQAKLNREERKLNLKNAFSIKKGANLKNRTILLADDVMTTGATLSAATAMLLQAGAGKVYVFVLGRR